jgi:class 3 adenylate cyclase
MDQLVRDMKAASGVQRIELLLELTDKNMEAGQWRDAAKYAEEAKDFAKKLNQPELRAEALYREGRIYRQNKKDKRAISAFQESNQILRNAGNRGLVLENLEQLRQIAEMRGDMQELQAIEAQIARVNARPEMAPPPAPEAPLTRSEMREEIANLTEVIQKMQTSESASATGRKEKSRQGNDLMARLEAQEALIQQMNEEQVKTQLLMSEQRHMLDSLTYEASLDSLAIANWNLELRRAESNRNFNYAVIGMLVLLFGGSLFSFLRARQNARVLEEKNKIIRAEQERSENLLLNILPALVAEELKKQGRTHARYFEDVSVLFADFVGFSKIAEKLSPQQLVTELDTCFKAFDEIIARHGLEKIKTIGDAYMCAGGLPNGGGAQLRNMVQAAKEMQAWLAQWNADRDKQNLPRFDARIGIHAGPVVAGVVGSKKFAFDIWGDTVNIAARVESAGEGGKINISGNVHELIKKDFPCEYRGKIAVKNKGEIDMYFVEN